MSRASAERKYGLAASSVRAAPRRGRRSLPPARAGTPNRNRPPFTRLRSSARSRTCAGAPPPTATWFTPRRGRCHSCRCLDHVARHPRRRRPARRPGALATLRLRSYGAARPKLALTAHVWSPGCSAGRVRARDPDESSFDARGARTCSRATAASASHASRRAGQPRRRRRVRRARHAASPASPELARAPAVRAYSTRPHLATRRCPRARRRPRLPGTPDTAPQGLVMVRAVLDSLAPYVCALVFWLSVRYVGDGIHAIGDALSRSIDGADAAADKVSRSIDDAGAAVERAGQAVAASIDRFRRVRAGIGRPCDQSLISCVHSVLAAWRPQCGVLGRERSRQRACNSRLRGDDARSACVPSVPIGPAGASARRANAAGVNKCKGDAASSPPPLPARLASWWSARCLARDARWSWRGRSGAARVPTTRWSPPTECDGTTIRRMPRPR